MKLKQRRHLLTSCVPLLVRILNDVTLLNLIRILHNKGGKVVWYFIAFLLCRSLPEESQCRSSAPSNRISCPYNLPKANFRKDAEECLSCMCLFKVEKVFINYIYYYNDDVTLSEIFPFLDSLFRPFVSKFLLHVLHSRLHF